MIRFLFILPILLLLIPKQQASAHAGFEKRVGDTVIYIKHSPISPFVGEKVTFYLSFRDDSIKTNSLNDQDLKNFPVLLSVIDTYYGDESKDEVIYKKQMVTDANGGFEFEYTFDKENYFDIELEFLDRNKNKQSVGFLIQPRSTNNIVYKPISDNKKLFLTFGIGLFGGITATTVLLKRNKKRIEE